MAGVDLDNRAAGGRLGLLAGAPDQGRPTSGGDAPIETGFGPHVAARFADCAPGGPEHVLDAKVFEDDQVVVPDQVRGGFLSPVFSAVGGPGVEGGDGVLGSRTPDAALALAGLLAFEAEQASRLAGAETGDVAVLPGAGGDGVDHTQVDTNRRSGAGTGDRRLRGAERDMPAAGPVFRDPGHAVLPEHSREPEADPADLGDVDLGPFAGDPRNLDVSDTETFVDILSAPGRTPVSAGPPVPQRLVEIPQGLLLHGGRAFSQPRTPAGFSQLAHPIRSPRCRPPDPVPIGLL
jgi:hypothetical protein